MSHQSDFEDPWAVVNDDPRVNDLPSIEEELFKMVYQWGRVGIVVDYTAPAYQQMLGRLKQLWSDKPF
jgi:hypothetical protein